jgi:TonB-linked SusC/RagA family outer membrane protein
MKKLKILTFLILFVTTAYAQQNFVVTGKVTDESDQGLPGVTILEKGGNGQRGTITDANGNYSFQTRSDATLVFSFIGFQTQEIEVNGRTNLNIQLKEEVVGVEEVVVVGYGVQKKRDITGSISGIKSEDIVKQPALSATQAVQGKLSGVQIVNSSEPGSNPQVRIRGVGTILSGADPLYVVDGVITTDIRNINPNDIVSMDVLKDASSAAIYGVRAANGVVLITTKAGKSGLPKVNYSGYAGFISAINKVDMAGSRFYAEYTNEALERQGSEPIFSDPGNLPYSTDWFDAVTRTAFTQSHNLSVNGGGEKTSYYFSMGYYEQGGILKENDYKRLNIRMNNTYELGPNIKIGNNLNISRGIKNNIPLSVFTAAYRQAPVVPVKDEEGNYGTSELYNNVGNPVATIDYTNDRDWENRLQGSLFAELTLLKDFTFKSSFGLDAIMENGRIYVPEYEVNANQRSEISKLTVDRATTSRWIWDNTLTYEKTFNKVHDITVMVGTTAESYEYEFLQASRENVPNDERYWYLSLGDEATAENGSQTEAGAQQPSKFTRGSYIGRATYGYKGKYLFTGTFRYDGSSKFPSGNRWALFPAFGVGWRMSEENFMQEITWIDNLKLRASYGQIGNDNIDPNGFIYTLNSGLNYVFGPGQDQFTGRIITDVKDLNLKWEKTTEIDVGLEYVLFDGKLSGEMDFYDKLTKGALINAPLDAVFGDTDFLTNKIDVRNRGFEISATWRDQLSNGLAFSVGTNWTFNSNRIEEVRDAIPINGGSLNNGYTVTRTEEGEPIGSFWVYQTDGIFQTPQELESYVNDDGARLQPNAVVGDFRLVDTNNDGSIDDNDRIYAGSYQPKVYFGLNVGLKYKQFDFSVDTYGNLGNRVYNGKKAQRWGGENIETSLAGRWREDQPSNEVPRAFNGNPVPSTYYVEKGNFFRFNNMTLGYTIKSPQKLKLSSLRVYLSAQNAFMFQKYSGFTPELPKGTLDSGLELDAYPTSATYMVGLNIGF